jgi:hypothetical protein
VRRLLNIGRLLLVGRQEEAEPLLRRALAIRDGMDAPHDAELVAILDALVEASVRLARHDDTGSLIARSLRVKAASLAEQPDKLLEACAAVIEPLAKYGRVEDLALPLQGGPVLTWPGKVKLLLRFAQLLLQNGREADMNEAVRLGVETLQKMLELEESDRFVALRELLPGFSDDDFRQMSEASDLEDDRVAHALGRIAAGCSMEPTLRAGLYPDDEEVIEIDGDAASPDHEPDENE